MKDPGELCASSVATWESGRSESNGSGFLPNTVGGETAKQDPNQEEVNVIIRGSGVYRVEGEEVPVRAGTVMRFDPETTRVPIAGPDGLTMVAVGARRGSYEPRGNF